jgi:hypothetical protein
VAASPVSSQQHSVPPHPSMHTPPAPHRAPPLTLSSKAMTPAYHPVFAEVVTAPVLISTIPTPEAPYGLLAKKLKAPLISGRKTKGVLCPYETATAQHKSVMQGVAFGG